jgi:hypothetical protein
LDADLESKPGVYLWCIPFNNVYRVIYVGQSKYLANRFREHISNQLCGASVILDSDVLEAQGRVERIYTPDDVKWMVEYLRDFPRLSMQAYRNLTLYSIFVAVVEPAHIGKLKLIESGIINALFNLEESKLCLLNTGLSKLSDQKNPIELLSDFQHGNVVVGVNQSTKY